MAIIKVNYTTSLDRAAKSIRYHAFRSREAEMDRKGMFDRTSDHADVRRFIGGLDDPLTNDWTTRRGRRVTPAKLHRLVISPRRSDFEACRLSSFKPLIREAMQTFELQQGYRLDWMAAEHLSAANPHVHIDIKSVYTAPDGTRHRLVLRRDQILQLRAIVDAIIEREKVRVREERRQEQAMDRAVHDITSGLLHVLREAGREDLQEAPGLAPRHRKRRPNPDREDDGRGR